MKKIVVLFLLLPMHIYAQWGSGAGPAISVTDSIKAFHRNIFVSITSSDVITINTADTYYTATFDSTAVANGFTVSGDTMLTYDADLPSGYFLVYSGLSYNISATNLIAHHSFFVNDVEEVVLEAERSLGTALDFGNASFGGLVYLESGYSVKTKIKSSKTGTHTANHGQLFLVRIF